MSRIRSLKPQFFKDTDLADKTIPARLLFAGLWGQADREGRMRDEPKYLKAEIFPYDDVDIEPMLEELAAPRKHKPGLIVRYALNGDRYIAVTHFLKHQKPHPKEPPSEIPPPPDPAGKRSCSAVEKNGETLSGPVVSGSLVLGSGSLDLGSGSGIAPAASPPQAASEPETGPVWTAYSTAYREQYGAEPIRNAKVNGQLAQLLKRLPHVDAPAVAAFYVRHPSGFYSRSGHPVGLLLQDCEKLHTEWVTNAPVTQTEARLNDKSAANFNGWSKFLSKGARHGLA